MILLLLQAQNPRTAITAYLSLQKHRTREDSAKVLSLVVRHHRKFRELTLLSYRSCRQSMLLKKIKLAGKTPKTGI
jgi:hypothetical protein